MGLVSVALYAWALWCRKQRDGSINHAFSSILVFMSVAVGSGAIAVFVVAWVIASSALNPGTPIEANMPPGFDGKFLYGILIFGAPLNLIWAIAEYHRHLDSDQ